MLSDIVRSVEDQSISIASHNDRLLHQNRSHIDLLVDWVATAGVASGPDRAEARR
jgi:hypothetical protein